MLKYLLLLFIFTTVNASELVERENITTISWTIPTERVDNTNLPLSELKEYRIYWGKDNTFNNITVVNNPSNTEYIIKDLPSGTYYFKMTAVDKNNLESAYSTTVSKTITIIAPPTELRLEPPTNLRIEDE